MRVTLLYFAAVRELAGLDHEEVELPAEIRRVADLPAWLERRHASLTGRLGSLRYARNEVFARADEMLEEGDVVAVIPPVAGG
jgi:molybdopterin converting factor subunit 1